MKSLVSRSKKSRRNDSTTSSRRWTHERGAFQRSRSMGSSFERLYTSLLCLRCGEWARERRRQVRSVRINLGAWRRQQVLGSRFDAPASRTSSFFLFLLLLLLFRSFFFPSFSLLPSKAVLNNRYVSCHLPATSFLINSTHLFFRDIIIFFFFWKYSYGRDER